MLPFKAGLCLPSRARGVDRVRSRVWLPGDDQLASGNATKLAACRVLEAHLGKARIAQMRDSCALAPPGSRVVDPAEES